MDFLKKESKDLKFKDNKSNDSFDNIPPPPKEGTQNTPPSDTGKESSQIDSMPSFPDTQNNTPANNEESPFAQELPTTQPDTDHAEFMPPGEFDEQPESPQEYMSKDIGWSQDPAYTNDQSVPETNFAQQSQNPFEDDQESDEDLSLPDLPDIPDSAKSESFGAKLDEQEDFAEVNEAQDNINRQGSKAQETIPEEPSVEEAPQEAAQEEPDDLPELEAEYLPEDEALEGEEKEQFVESYRFYETLQDIKALKRGFKDGDKIIKDWSELDNSAVEESEKFIDIIDTLQEEMIKIDSALFEEE